MIVATPGHGRITRITVHQDRWPTPGHAEARVVPFPTSIDPGDVPEEGGDPLPLVHHVEIVLPHSRGEHMTGAVIRFTDAESAKAFGRAAYRAAVMLGQTVPDYGTYEAAHVGAVDVGSLPDMTIASAQQ